MLELKFLRNNLEIVAGKLATRGFTLDQEKFLGLEQQRKVLQAETEQLQNQRNTQSKAIGLAKAKGEAIEPLLLQVGQMGEQLKQFENQLKELQQELNDFMLAIPNIPHDSVPIGNGEDDNVEVRRWGTPREFTFTPKDHVELGENKQWMDFTTASKLTGARFVVLRGPLARMHRALCQFMLDIHTTEHGYQEMYVPYIVNADSLQGTGQLPKFEEDQFALKGEHPTANCPYPVLS